MRSFVRRSGHDQRVRLQRDKAVRSIPAFQPWLTIWHQNQDSAFLVRLLANLINQAIAARKIVVGICLGSQLIGEALGAKVCQSPEKEIGHYPITLTEAGQQHPLFSHFGSPLTVGHWHNDMPGLTDQATILATSEGCPRQIVQYGNFVYGFQCHMEFTADAIEGLIQHSEQELAEAKGKRFIRSVEEMRAWDYQQMNEKLWQFLDKLVEKRNN